jgi:D-alanyl-D-alanine carboxypeptidase
MKITPSWLGWLAGAALLLTASCANAPAGPAERAPGPEAEACAAITEELQAALDASVKAQRLPGATAAVDAGGCHHRIASGVSDLVTKSAMPADALFRIGSITKTFVATAMLSLHAEGKLSLDAPVSTYVSGVPSGDRITVRQILNHTSGIYNYTDSLELWDDVAKNPDRVWRPEELIAVAAKKPLSFRPGQRWEYSNTNYIIAGLIAEKIDGRPLGELLRARVIDPAGLSRTYLDGAEPELSGLVRGYSLDGASLVDQTFAVDASLTGAAGAMVSNTADLNSFFAQLLGGEILGPAELHEMETWADTMSADAPGYGLGLLETRSPIGMAIGHGGGLWGFSSYSCRFSDSHTEMTVLVNDEQADVMSMIDALANVMKAR